MPLLVNFNRPRTRRPAFAQGYCGRDGGQDFGELSRAAVLALRLGRTSALSVSDLAFLSIDPF